MSYSFQYGYASLQEVATSLAKVIVQMQSDRLQALTLPADDCKSYLAFECTVMQDPGQELLIRLIADNKGWDSLFQQSVGNARDRETIGWVMTHDRCPGGRPGELSRQVLIELSDGEVRISRFCQSCHKDMPGFWQGVPASTRVTRWRELASREPLEASPRPVKASVQPNASSSSPLSWTETDEAWPLF